jgi:hypothetical protein
MRNLALCGLVILALTSGAIAQPNSGTITLAASPRQLGAGEDFPGAWEYVYDVNIADMDYLSEHGLSGFDTSAILNQWEYDPYQYEHLPQGTLVQYWSWWPANDYGDELCFGSYSTDGTTWTLHGEAWATDNPWHAPADYTGGSGILKAPAWFTGLVDEDNDSLAYSYRRGTGTNLTGMVMTFRIVHPNAPGTVDWWVSNKETSASDSVIFTDTGTIEGPGSSGPAPGDFDGDGDVDADDVDDLCANMGGDVGTYDMDNDGDVDEDDMTFHVENYLEYDSDGDGIADGSGTFRGDFNTDGTVNGTDLSILSGGFGTTTGFVGGNANCDTTVNGTDLSILSSVFGSAATAAVPEPATMSVVALGALALLRRKRS